MIRRPKVLKVGKFYSPIIGGVEKVMVDIVEGLKQDVDFTILTSQYRGRTKFEQMQGVQIKRLWSLGVARSMPLSPSFFWELPHHLKHNDLVHFHFPFPLAESAYVLTCNKKKPSIVWWHSDIVRQKYLLKLYSPFLKAFLNKVDCIITASPNHIKYSDFLPDYEKKCRVIPFGIDPSVFSRSETLAPKVEKLRNQYPWKHVLLFVGRLIYYKGIEYLITALKGCKDCGLIIIGDGALKTSLMAMIKEYGLDNRVQMLTQLPYEELSVYYNLCDLFVLPSIEKSEAFGLVQMEAMAAGKPVINTQIPSGVPFVSIDGETGLTVPPKDAKALSKAIQTLLSDDQLRNTMGQNALKRVQEVFHIQRFHQSLLSLYQSLL